MKTIFIISSYLFAVIIFSKVILHVYLDNKHGNKMYFGGLGKLKYLLPYEKEVSSEYEKTKGVCNYIQKLILPAFIILLFTLIMQNIQ